MIKMLTLGRDYVPPPIYAGGLRYHGVAPSLSLLMQEGKVNWREYGEDEIFVAAKLFSEAQGIVPAPESAHAVKAVIDEAKSAQRNSERKTIVFNLSGHGLLDLSNYESMMKRFGG
jgi:tryptophan synthase beta chain